MRGRGRVEEVEPSGTHPPPALTCRAPQVGMQLTFYGTAHPCCQNGTYGYGDVRTGSLREIWDGGPRRFMAEMLDGGEYPPGCEHCAVEHALGNRLATPAQAFDRFPDGSVEWPRHMEFTLSNTCNLECVHCNGDNSSAIRARREKRPPIKNPYGEEFFEQLPPFLDHLEVALFLGGEPFLMREVWRVWDMLLERDLRPEIHVTTNATIWNDRVEKYAHALEMNFAISIDGATKETYEAIRVGARYDRVIEIRDRLLAAARSYGGYVQLNFCLMPANAHELGAFLLQADELDVVANVIPVHQPVEHSLFALSPERLGPVVELLEAQDVALRQKLGRNLVAWERSLSMLVDTARRTDSDSHRSTELARLRADSEQLVARTLGSDILVPFPTRSETLTAESDPRAVTAVDALRQWSGTELLEVRSDGEQVVEVVVPAWAQVLTPHDWVGGRLSTIQQAVTDRLGPVEVGEPLELAPGVTQTASVVATPAGPAHFRTLYLELPGLVLLASRDLASPSNDS